MGKKEIPFAELPLAIGATEFEPLVEALKGPGAPYAASAILPVLGDKPIDPGEARDLPIIGRQDLKDLADWLGALNQPRLQWFINRCRFKASPT